MNTSNSHLWRYDIEKVVEQALTEDLGWGDATTRALIPAGIRGKGIFLSKMTGVIAGLEICQTVFKIVDSSVQFIYKTNDGDSIKPGDIIAIVEGDVRSLLKAERVSLNFLQRLSGIATETRAYVDAVKGIPVRIVDTRKTTPGLRRLEKYAVTVGGGFNHRMHLGDGILIKDNHLAIMYSLGKTMKEIIGLARNNSAHTLKIEVEVKNYQEAMEAFESGADILLLDNMDVETMSRVMKQVKGKVLTEASGGVRLANVRTIAETGVDFISIGAITHSAKALDISLEIEGINKGKHLV